MKKFLYLLLFTLNNIVLSYVIYLCYQDTYGVSLYEPPFNVGGFITVVVMFGSPFWIVNILFLLSIIKKSKNK